MKSLRIFRRPVGPFQNRKVSFVIAGTQKGGTSALGAYLRSHQEICMANLAEVHFFDKDDYFQQDEADYSIYHSCFSPKSSNHLLGETTPIYMYWYDAPRRIWRYNSRMKIIIILRNPIERAFSHWNMERDRGAEELSFWEAIQSEQERCREALPYQHRVYSYIDRGFYADQLRRVWHYFPREQTLILRNEELRIRPKEALEKVCNLLGVTPFQSVEERNVHSRPYVTSLERNEKEFLRCVYEHEIKELERLLGWDCSAWLGG